MRLFACGAKHVKVVKQVFLASVMWARELSPHQSFKCMWRRWACMPSTQQKCDLAAWHIHDTSKRGSFHEIRNKIVNQTTFWCKNVLYSAEEHFHILKCTWMLCYGGNAIPSPIVLTIAIWATTMPSVSFFTFSLKANFPLPNPKVNR